MDREGTPEPNIAPPEARVPNAPRANRVRRPEGGGLVAALLGAGRNLLNNLNAVANPPRAPTPDIEPLEDVEAPRTPELRQRVLRQARAFRARLGA